MDRRKSIQRQGTCTQSSLDLECIPLELWLHIIESAHLTRADIATLTTVSKFLRRIAQPILFAEISVTLLLAKKNGIPQAFRCQHSYYYKRLKRRLSFAMSQRIAPAVKSLVIRCGTGQEIDPEMHELVEEEKVVESLFHVLRHFPNIKAFSAEGVTLAEVHFEQLLQLPYLIGMHLDTCSASGDLRLSRFKMKSLSLHGEMSGTFGWWIPLLRSDALVHLSYDSRKQVKPEEPKELVLPAIATGPLMNHLRILRLPAYSTRFPCFIIALSRCPVIEDLCIEECVGAIPPEVEEPLPRNVLKHLKALSAPFVFVQRCLPGRQLKHIRTTLSRGNSLGTLLLSVQSHSPRLEELALCAGQIYIADLLNSILSALRHLRGLYISLLNFQTQPKEFYSFLRRADYPPNLISFHLIGLSPPPRPVRFLLGTDNPSLTPQDVTERHPNLLRYIRRKSPHLADLYLHIKTESINWVDDYIKPVKWYKWDERGMHLRLP